jgi:hypothetical protein
MMTLDTIDNAGSSRHRPGKIGFKYDEQMTRSKAYTIFAEIGYPGAPLVFSSPGETKTILISDLMKCSLIGHHFIIEPLHSEEQVVLSDLPTSWKWTVTPLKKGTHELTLIASRKIKLRDETGFRDEPAYIRYVSVKISPVRETALFVANNWQWLVGTIVGSGIIWQILKKGK